VLRDTAVCVRRRFGPIETGLRQNHPIGPRATTTPARTLVGLRAVFAGGSTRGRGWSLGAVSGRSGRLRPGWIRPVCRGPGASVQGRCHRSISQVCCPATIPRTGYTASKSRSLCAPGSNRLPAFHWGIRVWRLGSVRLTEAGLKHRKRVFREADGVLPVVSSGLCGRRSG
jgi:hypothetical protein